jgi:hypothetical protein
MRVIANTTSLVHDNIISPDQAHEIEKRSRAAMTQAAVNIVLFLGILTATSGLVVWLQDVLSVAVAGGILLGLGVLILRQPSNYMMFGSASVLIGAGMMLGGAGLKIQDLYPDEAAIILAALGAVLGIASGAVFRKIPTTRFVIGAIFCMTISMHLLGINLLINEYYYIMDLPKSLILFYMAAVLGGVGVIVDVRLITALAIIPFAQIFDTVTIYFSLTDTFYSPESTLTIIQMVILISLCLWGTRKWPERFGRHAGILAIMGFLVANLAALVGSLGGDHIGSSYIILNRDDFDTWVAYDQAAQAALDTLPYISQNAYSVIWAVALVVLVFWSASRNQRGLFNASLTFGAIHFYTQIFETFWDEPLAWVIGGLVAIPLAWGVWQLNQRMISSPVVSKTSS